MAFKVVVSEKEKSLQMELDAANSKKLVGLTIGEEFDGSLIGLKGYKLKITGGSDKNGFPMRKDISGPRRIKSLLAGGIGFNPTRDGLRRRKTVRGNTVSDDIVQINTIVTQSGEKSLDEIKNPSEE
ncbi:30S ribosomal protein S6e [Methanobacterium alkalithermotolerans]|uniref:Small ribosomal subunit protein eS6 n=1 Tax=Methanobacterium alkalithermotolerans TaxID=2731220 RepID=A0A8T8K302_9EURY|nr:30S ribosomal protein S6e [Methanobacterium alkalithermotolerans]QUH22269.1 30S ribosomal protein S6e [Methanobacterium alkalithermotolerans]RJS49599.1 MAG: 30S ribosomal protein S6e [Methanobacterium sp.]